MKRLPVAALCGFLLLIGGRTLLFAHGALTEQLLKLTAEIKESPNNPELYLRRAEAFRASRVWDDGLADYDRALKLNFKMPGAHLGRAKLLLEAAWPHAGLYSVEEFLAQKPDHYDGYITRARLYRLIEKYPESIADYAKAMELPGSAKPDYFIEWSRCIQKGFPDKPEDALKPLDQGIATLGPIVTLQLEAIELEVKAARYELALKRVDAIAAQTPRKETFLNQKGEILLKAGKPKEAKVFFEQALESIQKLPEARRNVRATIDLEKKIRDHLAQL